MKKIRITKKELWNLNGVLADIIHQYLVAFKAYDRHLVLYSPDYADPDWDPSGDIRDETDWFLDELIWTFKTISEGGVSSIPEVEELIGEVFGGERSMVIDDEGYVSFNLDEEKYAKLREIEGINQDRINRGLELFAKNFERLWD